MEIISKRHHVTKKQIGEYILGLESSFNSWTDFKTEVIRKLETETVRTDKYQLRFYKAVLDQLNEKNELDIPKHKIQLLCWLKNNNEWYEPLSLNGLSLDIWEHYEIINYYNVDNFLVFCWNGKKQYNESRLFKARIKN